MATLALTNDEVYASLGALLGISRTYTEWDSVTLADVNRIIRSGRRRFFSAAPWSFLEMNYPLVTTAPQSTGTVTMVNGVVTLSGATWPSDVVDNYVVEIDGGVYSVASRDSSTQITLNDVDSTTDADAGTSYVAYKFSYALPSNFAGFLDPITRENNTQLKEYATLPEWTVRAVGNRTSVRSDEPEIFSLMQIPASTTGIPAWYLRLYPLPDKVYVLHTRIRIQPEDTLDLSTSLPVAHAVFAECMLEAILAAGELAANDKRGEHHERFVELLAEAIKKDKSMKGTRSLRPQEAQSRVPDYQLLVAPVTYNEV